MISLFSSGCYALEFQLILLTIEVPCLKRTKPRTHCHQGQKKTLFKVQDPPMPYPIGKHIPIAHIREYTPWVPLPLACSKRSDSGETGYAPTRLFVDNYVFIQQNAALPINTLLHRETFLEQQIFPYIC